jgi:parvulin-like peptidyl-prolyl isomerase
MDMLFPASRTPASRVIAQARALAAVVCAAFLATTEASFGQSPVQDPVIARIGDTEIRQSDLRLAEQEIGQSIPEQEASARQEFLLTYLSDVIMLAKAAEKQNFADDAQIKRRMEFARSRALSEKLLQATAQNAVTAEVVRKAYDDAIKTTPAQPELRLRSILFKFSSPDDTAAVAAAEARAKVAATRIAKGEDFGEVARQMSDNEAARFNGGDMGYLTRPEMGKEYAEVAFSLGKGAVSAPIKTEFGWHLIKLDDTRMRTPAEFDAVRPRFEALIARKAQFELMAKLRSEMHIERLDGAAKPAGTENKPADAEK